MTAKKMLKVIDKIHDYPCPYGIGGTAWQEIRNCIEKQIPNTDSEKPSSLESENAALRQLLKLAVGDIEDIHENVGDDYVCSKCAAFDVYTFCKRRWGGGCQFKWRHSDKIEKLLKESCNE